MVRRSLTLLGWAVMAAPALAQTAPATGPLWAGAYVQADLQAWSNGLPVLDINGPWSKGYEARDGQQRAYQAFRAEAGVRIDPGWTAWPGAWKVGLLARADALLAMSGEAAELAAHYQRQTDPSHAATYDSAHTSLSWKGRGVSLRSPAVQLGALRMDLGLEWFRLSRLRRTSTEGLTTYDGAGSYGYDLALRDDSDRTDAPFMDPPARSGHGAALSIALAWSPRDDFGLDLRVHDLWSRLVWRGINGDDATLTSEVSTRTPEGYIDYQPALQGRYTQRTLQERIPTTVEAQATWRRAEGDWSVRLHRRWGLQQAWVGWQAPGTWRWQVAVEPRWSAVQLGLDVHGLSVRAMADRVDQAAHVRAVNVAYTWVR